MNFNLPVDPELVAMRNRRRIAEEERKARIFNPRERLIGIDKGALIQQVHDEKLRKTQEEERNLQFCANALKWDREAVLKQKRQEAEIHQLNKELDRFRLTEQKPEDRREFDLNDPNARKKELPLRVDDDDSSCGVSGLQKMEGEDINYKERKELQTKQNREWLIDQMLDRRMQLDKQNNEIHLFEKRLEDLDRRAQQTALKEVECRRKVAEGTSEFNKDLARHQNEKKRQKEIADELDKLEDIYNTFYGDLLSEDPYAARSSFGPHRVVPQRWKGMNKEQLQEFYDGQKTQMVDNKRKQETEKEEEAKWDKMRLQQDRQAILKERSEARKRVQEDKNRLSTNSQLARSQAIQKNHLEKVVYRNVPTDEYFSQFNTTTR